MELMDYLGAAKHYVFRFEYLQDFSASDAVLFEQWKKTGAIDASKMQDWWDFIEKKHHDGVLTQRVRRVVLPLVPYTQFELEVHRMTAMHNDDIRIITDDKFQSLSLPAEDFWLMDDATVITLRYDANGAFLGIDKQNDVQKYIKAKNILLAYSMPLNMFEEK